MNNHIASGGVWNEALAATLEGSLVLVGITFVDAEGRTIRDEQCFGRITNVDQSKGLELRLEGSRAGELFRLPPDTRSVFGAAPGTYRLRSTEDVVTDPDFTIAYVVHAHHEQN